MSIAYLTIAALLLIALLIVLLAFAAGAAEWWLRYKKSRWQAQSNEAPLAAAPLPPSFPVVQRQSISNVARWNLFAAVFVFGALAILAPFPWLLFGNTGLPLVRMGTIGVLLAALYIFVSAAIAIAIGGPASRGPASRGEASNRPAHGDETSSHADLVARITQRFCPQCRAPLAADAPEGLCPACLMAGGMVSALDPAGRGMAATTPPAGRHGTGNSRSELPTLGDWTDLAERLPQLEILELLGRGGMGSVYKARQKNLDRIIAVKVIPPEATKDSAFAERFAREARALARLNHPNIVTVYDFGQAGDVYYLLMEYVDGVNLRHAQQASRLSPEEALAIVPQICDALQYAHNQGVIHRDIKPENVLLDRSGRVKIADFGLAKLLGKGVDDFTLTGTQQVMGTPRYMAPEQIEKPASVDHRADIYSLGVVIYEMLTGELPIGRFQPPSHKVQVDVRIDDVVLRALEKEPERRYQRASHVKTDLASAGNPAAAYHNQAERPVWRTPAPPPPKENLAASSFLGIALLLALGMQIGLLFITAGFAAFLYGLMAHPGFGDKFWGWTAAGIGCLSGGWGCLLGCYFSYRNVAGAEDLTRSPRFTWFDWIQIGHLMVSIAFLVAAAGAYRRFGNVTDTVFALLSIGISVAIPAGIILARRALVIAAAQYTTPGLPELSPESLLSAFTSAFGNGVAMLRNLSRSKKDVYFGGICGGLGETTPVPAWCWRMLFLVLIFGYGFGAIAYIVLCFCMPEAEAERTPPLPYGPVTKWLRQFSRSHQDAMLGGVCAGLGEHTPLPAWCWRVLFIGLTLAYGVGIAPYLLLWICVPEVPSGENPDQELPDPAVPPTDDQQSWQPAEAAAKPRSDRANDSLKRPLFGLLILAGVICLILFLSCSYQSKAGAFSLQMGFPDAWLVLQRGPQGGTSGMFFNRWSMGIGLAGLCCFWSANRLAQPHKLDYK